MWIRKVDDNWDLITDYGGFSKRKASNLTQDVFGRANRLSTKEILLRLNNLGVKNIYNRSMLRLCMELTNGYEIAALDLWRGSHKAVNYCEGLENIRFSDEEQLPVIKLVQKFNNGLFVRNQWEDTKFSYGDVVWIFSSTKRKRPLRGGVVFDRSIETNGDRPPYAIIWCVGAHDERCEAITFGQTENSLTLIRKKTSVSLALADAWLSKNRKLANRLSQEPDIQIDP